MISGLSTEELDWITKESEKRNCIELSSNFTSTGTKELTAEMYPDINAAITKEMNEIERQAIPKSTQSATENHVKKFKSFLHENNLSTDIEAMPIKFLAEYLRFFYFKLKCKDGSSYSPMSLVAIRASINRYLNSPEVNRSINIMEESQFQRANGILKAKVGEWLRGGNKQKKGITLSNQTIQKR